MQNNSWCRDSIVDWSRDANIVLLIYSVITNKFWDLIIKCQCHGLTTEISQWRLWSVTWPPTSCSQSSLMHHGCHCGSAQVHGMQSSKHMTWFCHRWETLIGGWQVRWLVFDRFMHSVLSILQTDWSNRSYFSFESSRHVSHLLSAAIQVSSLGVLHLAAKTSVT